MGNLIFNPTEVHTSPQYALGARGETKDGRQWRYVKTAVALAAKRLARFDPDGNAYVADASANFGGKRTGIPQAAIAKDRYCWLLVGGAGTLVSSAAIVRGAPLHVQADGRVDDAGGREIAGAFATAKTDGANEDVPVELIDPHYNNT